MSLTERKIRWLIYQVEVSNINSLEVRDWTWRVRVIKYLNPPISPVPVTRPSVPPIPIATKPPAEPVLPQRIEVRSPMVGTFFRAQDPEAKPLVEVGQTIQPGEVLCCIQAMKLMTEVKAEQPGRIAQVVAENGQPVEFGQVLFQLDPVTQ